MRRRTVIASLLSPVAISSLAGCMATTPRTRDEDRGVGQVAVCSLLDPRIEILTLGITVFGNKLSTLPPNHALNATIDREMQSVLQTSRPHWKVAAPEARAEIDSKIMAFGKPGRFQFEQAQSLLREILQKSRVDILFTLLPDSGDYVRIPGLSLEYNRGSASPTISSRVYVLGSDANVITQRALFTIGFNDVPRLRAAIATDLHSPGETEDKRRVAEMTIDYGRKSVASALKVLGYSDA